MSPKQATRKTPTIRVMLIALALGLLVFVGLRSVFNTSSGPGPEPAGLRERPVSPNSSAGAKSIRLAKTETQVHPSERVKPTLGLKPGDRLDYAFSQTHQLELAAPVETGMTSTSSVQAPLDVAVRQNGTLIVTVYGEEPKGWTVGFRMDGASVEWSSEFWDGVLKSNELNETLKQEIMAFVQKSGRIESLASSQCLSAEARNQWRDILARWQVILPERDTDLGWSREEEDSTGTCLVRYTRTPPLTRWAVTKKRDHYVRLAAFSRSSTAIQNTITGKTDVELEPYPVRIEGEEEIHLSGLGFGHQLKSRSRFVFRLNQVVHGPPLDESIARRKADVLSPANQWSWNGEALTPAPDTVRQPVEAADVAHELDTLKDLLSHNKLGSPEQVRAMANLRVMVCQDDGVVDAMLDELAADSPDGDYSAALLGILGSAGTPEAQSALLGIATSDDWPEEQKRMALFSFAQVAAPIPEVDAWLKTLHEGNGPLSGNALLILGAVGDRLRESDPDRHQQITAYLTQCANAGTLSEDQQVVALDALGNLGPRDIPVCVRSALESQSAILREHALLSLQRVEGEAADGILTRALVDDPSSAVRMAAAKLLGNTSRTRGCEMLVASLSTEITTGVRKQILISLGEWAPANNQARVALQNASTRDPDPETRELALHLLNPLPPA